MKKPLIISTDPGIDDAVALAICLFNNTLDIKLIAAAAGNVGINYTTNNILKLEAFFKKKVPVVKGVSHAILKNSVNASSVHGKSGMDGYDFPEPDRSLLLNEIAPDAIHKIVANSKEKVTLMGIAPLTDYAIYFRLYPEDLLNIEELIIMGGSIGRGNYGVFSEFNIAGDPEAAKIIFESGVKIRVAPLELGFQAKIMPNISEKIRKTGKIGNMFYSLFKKYRGGSFDSGLKIYDALAAGILLNPNMFKFEKTHVEIVTQEGFTYGASLMDFQNRLKLIPNAEIAKSVDVKKFVDWFVNALNVE